MFAEISANATDLFDLCHPNSLGNSRHFQELSNGVPVCFAENPSVDHQDIFSLEHDSEVDMKTCSVKEDGRQAFDDASSKDVDQTHKGRSMALVPIPSLQNKPSPVQNRLRSLKNIPGDQLVLVPISMLSLKSSSLYPFTIPQEPGSRCSIQCNTLSEISFDTKSNQMISDANNIDATQTNTTLNVEKSTREDNAHKSNPSYIQNEETLRYEKIEEPFYSPPSPSTHNQLAIKGRKAEAAHSMHHQDRKKSKRRGQSNDHEYKKKPNICQICGDMAGRHSYYGGRSCPSCRAFFRRFVEVLAT